MSDEDAPARRSYAEGLEINLVAIADLLTDLKEEIEKEWRKVRAGGEKKHLEKHIKSDLPALVQLAIKEEGRLHEQSSQRSGRAGIYAIDFGQARADIGSRLARLRNAADAERLSR